MRITNRTFVWLCAIFILVGFADGQSSSPHIRRYSRFNDLQRGTADGISITSLGELVLSPQLSRKIDTGDPFVWCVANDSHNNIYLGTGNDGRVYRISSQGDSSLFFDAPELEVYCLAVDKRDNIVVGTSPNGKVYQLSKNGESNVIADPPDTYIWALEFDHTGNLYIATGQKGRIYKVDRHGELETFFESEQTHIRSLTIDNQGRVFAGSGGDGYVYSFSQKGDAFVLYDTPMREVHDLAVTTNGIVYAACVGEEGVEMPVQPERMQTKKSTESEQQSEGATEISLSPQALMPSSLTGRGSERSAIYRIDQDGAARDIWDSDSDRVQCFIVQDENVLLVGTGDHGRLYRLTTASERSLILDMEESQISHLQMSATGEIQVSTSNMGRTYTLGPDIAENGSYLSEVFDTRVLAQWGNISWEEKSTNHGKVKLYTRTGNTEEAGQTWSEWSRAFTNSAGETITSPPARFIQWKCELQAFDTDSPIIDDVAIAYLQKNLPPVITAIIIHRQGKYYPSGENKNSSSNGIEGRKGIVFPAPLGESKTKKSFRSVDWLFEDPNSDELLFDLFYKNEEDTR